MLQTQPQSKEQYVYLRPIQQAKASGIRVFLGGPGEICDQPLRAFDAAHEHTGGAEVSLL